MAEPGVHFLSTVRDVWVLLTCAPLRGHSVFKAMKRQVFSLLSVLATGANAGVGEEHAMSSPRND